jgi:hypothetical protein
VADCSPSTGRLAILTRSPASTMMPRCATLRVGPAGKVRAKGRRATGNSV